MTRHVLVVSYSQTGQLTRLCDSFVCGLAGEDVSVERIAIEPQTPYPFPWPFLTFFNTFPETVHLKPAPIRTPVVQREQYDLIVIAYTVWFLSPAQPITAFVQSEQGRALLRGTPVVTLIGCRNMWLMAQEKMKTLLTAAGARLVGNVVKIDQCSSAASFITTPMWMLTGKKKAASWLPEAGISGAEIDDTLRFGARVGTVLRQGQPLDETLLQNIGAVKVNEKLILSERFAHRSFYLWGKLIMAAGRRSPLLRRGIVAFYIVFLVAIILTVVPVSALLKRLSAPLLRQKIQAQKARYGWPSGE